MKKQKHTFVLILFLLGIFMGAIDSGIVSPAREIIQNSFGVSRGTGTWMITIYTLFYAISMPITSKMSDRYGRKKVYTIGIAVFGIGSLLCGLSNFFGTFTFFLIARIIQAIGAGGILPIATTVIGQSFPEEKRGTALGLVGAVYGVATIVGPTIGSAILTIGGNNHWGFIFFINLPICISILILSIKFVDTPVSEMKKLDILGSLLTAGVVSSLLYALTNIDFFNIATSLTNTNVYPFLILFLILIPLLVLVENRAVDPVLNMKYFKSKDMLVVFALALLIGIGMMSMVFVPQFAENVLKIKSGSGGYLITLLAVFSGVAAPLSGKLLDKKGTRVVLLLGFGFTIIGTLVLGYIATKTLTFPAILLGLAGMGLGVGFTMGPPLNYLVLKAVPEEEGATALATMSLIRSIGVTISPSIMIGFIVRAAKNVQGELMTVTQTTLAAATGGEFMPNMSEVASSDLKTAQL
ncbi:MAG: MFS transporter, partial [Vallitaleaceae bacterium]|nr:MFS transporter [Vallitaleaceae bacterium]